MAEIPSLALCRHCPLTNSTWRTCKKKKHTHISQSTTFLHKRNTKLNMYKSYVYLSGWSSEEKQVSLCHNFLRVRHSAHPSDRHGKCATSPQSVRCFRWCFPIHGPHRCSCEYLSGVDLLHENDQLNTFHTGTRTLAEKPQGEKKTCSFLLALCTVCLPSEQQTASHSKKVLACFWRGRQCEEAICNDFKSKALFFCTQLSVPSILVVSTLHQFLSTVFWQTVKDSCQRSPKGLQIVHQKLHTAQASIRIAKPFWLQLCCVLGTKTSAKSNLSFLDKQTARSFTKLWSLCIIMKAWSFAKHKQCPFTNRDYTLLQMRAKINGCRCHFLRQKKKNLFCLFFFQSLPQQIAEVWTFEPFHCKNQRGSSHQRTCSHSKF